MCVFVKHQRACNTTCALVSVPVSPAATPACLNGSPHVCGVTFVLLVGSGFTMPRIVAPSALLALLLCACFHSAASLVFPTHTLRKNLTANQWLVIDRFGFEPHGSMDLSLRVVSTLGIPVVNASATAFELLVCPADDFPRVLRSIDSPARVGQVYQQSNCGSLSRTLCFGVEVPVVSEASRRTSEAEALISRTFYKDDVFYLALSTCGLPSWYANSNIAVTAK